MRIPLLADILRNSGGFVLYRNPGQTRVNLVAGNTLQLKAGNLPPEPGFFIRPFADVRGIFITEKISREMGYEELPAWFTPECSAMLRLREHLPEEPDADTYFAQVDRIKAEIEGGNISKAVLSRPLFHSHSTNPVQAFTGLLGAYPHAFCYLLYTPQSGCWMGATPETLLTVKDGRGVTHSLAGSCPADRIEWTNKEVHEQQLVTDFILSRLHAGAVSDIVVGPQQTVIAGPVAHLRNVISFKPGDANVANIAEDLHPTPAVCGLPMEKALALILATEKHNRELYTGFLGPWSGKGEADFYVNLRCLEFFDTGAVLYVGGGITAGSDPLREWEETRLKAETLLRILKN